MFYRDYFLFYCLPSSYLPSHLVGLVTLPQAERAGEVAGQQVDLLDASNQSLIDGLLVSSTAAVNLSLL